MNTIVGWFAILILLGIHLPHAASQQRQNAADQPQTEPQEEATPEEISKQRYDLADTDSDGSISREEFKTYVETKLPGFPIFDGLMTILDTDRDDKISLEEFGPRQQVAQKLIAAYEARMEALRKPKEFADQFNERFAGRKPVVGDTIDNLVAFDEDGAELDFADLRGKYTVINFGCLT
jgi:hypothetical protein